MEVWAPEVAARGAASRTAPTFQAYADVWLEMRKTKGRELRPTTGRQYRMLLDKFIYPTFGKTRIDEITNEDVNAWYDDLAPGRETIRAQSYSLLRTIFASAASERPIRWSRKPGPHPGCRQHQAGTSRSTGDARGAPDNRRGAARPLQADGTAGGVVCHALR